MVSTAVAGCGELPPAGRNMLRSGSQAYREGRYDDARTVLTQFLSQYGATDPAAEAYYVRGLCRLRQRDREGARKDMHLAVGHTGNEDLLARARAVLGSMAYEDGDWAAAVEHYAPAVTRLPPAPPLDQILYRHGVSLQRLGRWAQARDQFSRLLQAFPNSSTVPHARRAFSWRQDWFSIQCGAYQQRGSAATEAGRLTAALKAGDLKAEHRLDWRGGQAVYVVRVGRFPTYAEAVRRLPHVRRQVPDAFIVP